jgi:hypothetical protein
MREIFQNGPVEAERFMSAGLIFPKDAERLSLASPRTAD